MQGFVAGDDVINSKIALLLLQALIIISLARLLGWLFSFIKEPMVIAEMVAGILLGPTVMGRIPGFTENIFPPESLPLLQICSQLGLLLFMFVVGLELDIALLRKKIKAAVVASVAGVCVPMLIAIPLMFLFYKPEFLGHDHHGTHPTISRQLSLFSPLARQRNSLPHSLRSNLRKR